MNENEFEQMVEANKPGESSTEVELFNPNAPINLHVDLNGAENSNDIEYHLTDGEGAECRLDIMGLKINLEPYKPIMMEAVLWGKAQGEFTIKSLSAYTMEELHAEIARRA